MKFDGSQKLFGVLEEEFVLVDNEDEAKFVDRRLNDKVAKKAKARRMKHLRDNGEVNEVLMPDAFSALSCLAVKWHYLGSLLHKDDVLKRINEER